MCYGSVAGILKVFLIVILANITTSCEDAMVDAEKYGAIEGMVLSDSTGNAIENASVTTSPATEAILTDEEGRFMFDDIPTGEYSVSVRKRNYERSNVSISVREHRVSQATILLGKNDENNSASEAEAEVTVTKWWNETEDDSTYSANVEYRIENTGEIDISEYEITFVIQTSESAFYQNEEGQSLQVGRSKVGEFEKFIREEEAESVELYDLWLKAVNEE